MKTRFKYLVIFSALLVAGCAAFFSVFGLSHLFAGAKVSVIIMTSSLEFAKIVAVTFLHRYWYRIGTALKLYLSTGVGVLMIITSLGIYSFLINAYQKTANKLENTDLQIEIIESKKLFLELHTNQIYDQIELKNKRVETLINQRHQQEIRLDSLYNRRWYNSARRTEDFIKRADNDISISLTEISVLVNKVTNINDSINKLDFKILEIGQSDVSGEIGPLKYLSVLLNKSMDTIVNWFVLLIIFIFDPLAVSLIIAFNIIVMNERMGIDDSNFQLKLQTPVIKQLFNSYINKKENIKKESQKDKKRKDRKPNKSILSLPKDRIIKEDIESIKSKDDEKENFLEKENKEIKKINDESQKEFYGEKNKTNIPSTSQSSYKGVIRS